VPQLDGKPVLPEGAGKAIHHPLAIEVVFEAGRELGQDGSQLLIFNQRLDAFKKKVQVCR
jgi:hypothetical protein